MSIQESIICQINEIRVQCAKLKPVLVINCCTYNHGEYLKDAIEGFVMQKTNFPFVAIVHDDASTDNTALVLRKYAEKYPNIIKPIFESENQYSKSDGNINNIINCAIEATGAKYIALCEGDDYWIDPYKLQKQFDFLEAHYEYSMCFHKVNIIGSNEHKDNDFDLIETKDYTTKELLTKWVVQTASIVLRKEIWKRVPFHQNFCVGDSVLLATCVQYGKIYGFSDIMAVYRRTSNGWTLRSRESVKSILNTNEKLINHYNALISFFPELKVFYIQRIINLLSSNTLYGLKYHNKILFKSFLIGIRDFKFKFLQSLIQQIVGYHKN